MATARCTWTEVSGVDGYNVYLKSNGEFVKQNSELITDTVYDIEGLEDGNYEAYATSVLNNVESDASNVNSFDIGQVESPTIESISEYEPGSIRSSHTIDRPAGTVEGNLLLLSLSARSGQSSALTFTLPSGWTQIDQIRTGSASQDTAHVVAFKVAGASEPSSYTVTSNLNCRPAGAISRISGADQSDPIITHSDITGGIDDITTPSISCENGTLLVFVAGSSQSQTSIDISVPEGMLSIWSLINESTGSIRHGTRGASENVNSGASGDRTATHNGGTHTGLLIAIRP